MAFDKRKSLQNALTFTQQGKWDRAIAEYQAILKADPRDLTVCNNLGDLYARAGKVADAIEQYVKLGELYRADGLSVKAIAVYKKIAKLDPTNIAAYQACADLYWEQGLVGEAKIQMTTVVEHFAKVGDTAKLTEAYRRLAQFDPTNIAAIAKLADLLLKAGTPEEAAIEYDRAAQAAQAAGQAAEAKRLFQKARDLLPQAAEANLGLAEMLRGEGKLAEAVDVLEKVTAAEPENAKGWQTLGEVRASLGLGAEAVTALQKAMALGTPEGAVATSLGQALLQTGRADEAVALCERLGDEALEACWRWRPNSRRSTPIWPTCSRIWAAMMRRGQPSGPWLRPRRRAARSRRRSKPTVGFWPWSRRTPRPRCTWRR
jgi:tetratricopeptide (TPR) repeat protein